MLYTSLLSSAGATETSGRYGVRMRTETKAVRRIEPGAHTRQQGVWLLLLGGQCRLPVGRLTAYQQYACNKFGGLPGCPRNPTRRESKGSLRNLSLQLRRHPGLGLFPDQHGAPDEARTEPAGFAGLPGQHRPCVSVLPGARFPAMEHVHRSEER